MRWIPFSERQPTPDEMCEGLWLANHERRALWRTEDGSDRWNRLREACTHFCPVTPPTDLPPKPLPKLSEGSEWQRGSSPCIMRNGNLYRISADGNSLIISTTCVYNHYELSLSDIEALKAVGK